MKRGIKKIFVVSLAVLMAFLPGVSAFGLSESQLDAFAQNNILFYDPDEVSCYSGGSLSGATVAAKVVDYLKGNNPTGFVLSDNGVAGILANFQGESGLNPFRYQSDSPSGPAYGIAQFDPMSKIQKPLRTDPRTANYFNEYIDIKYTYYDPETGLPTESVPMEVVDAWLSVQMDFFFDSSSEFENTKIGTYRNMGGTMGLGYITDGMTVHQAMDAAKTPEDATRIFIWIMERPGDKEGGAKSRGANAQKWLKFVQSISSGSGEGSSASSSVSGSDVTIIGDSIAEGARNQLEKVLPGVDIHAQTSKQFYTGTSDNPGGITILKDLVTNNSLRDTLVYALGTNSSITSEQAQEVVNTAGNTRKVIFVTNYTTANDYTANNNVLAKVKNDNSNVYIADWKAAIESQESTYLSNDGVHPNDAGKELFADVIATTVSNINGAIDVCATFVEGGLTEQQAQKLADYYNNEFDTTGYSGFGTDAGNGGKNNCVAFTAFFVQKLTSIGKVNRTWGDGKDTANKLAKEYSLMEGNELQPYTVFSVTAGSTVCEDGHLCGHTGIIVAVDGENIITVEAGYPNTPAYVNTSRKKSYFTNTKHSNTFTYLNSILDGSALTEIVGN